MGNIDMNKSDGQNDNGIKLDLVNENGNSSNGASFPNSKKIHVNGKDNVHVPMREIELADGEEPLRVYDCLLYTSDAADE